MLLVVFPVIQVTLSLFKDAVGGDFLSALDDKRKSVLAFSEYLEQQTAACRSVETCKVLFDDYIVGTKQELGAFHRVCDETHLLANGSDALAADFGAHLSAQKQEMSRRFTVLPKTLSDKAESLADEEQQFPTRFKNLKSYQATYRESCATRVCHEMGPLVASLSVLLNAVSNDAAVRPSLVSEASATWLLDMLCLVGDIDRLKEAVSAVKILHDRWLLTRDVLQTLVHDLGRQRSEDARVDVTVLSMLSLNAERLRHFESDTNELSLHKLVSDGASIRAAFSDISKDWQSLQEHFERVVTAAKEREQLETERIKSEKKAHVASVTQNLVIACDEFERIVTSPIPLPAFDLEEDVSVNCSATLAVVKQAEENLKSVRDVHQPSIMAKKELKGVLNDVDSSLPNIINCQATLSRFEDVRTAFANRAKVLDNLRYFL